MSGTSESPDWPPLTLEEVDALLRNYPQAGAATELLSHSPRPFSSASIVATPLGKVFVKRHHHTVRDQSGLLEEHHFLNHLADANWGTSQLLVHAPLPASSGQTALQLGEWLYEVHTVAPGLDLYEDALSWTPFQSPDHARAAGRALAQLHNAAQDYTAPARKTQQLVTSFDIFSGSEANPADRLAAYLAKRPLLREYAEARHWRSDLEALHLPFYLDFAPLASHLTPLWTHNDLHASNLMWAASSPDAKVSAIVDFGLADRTNAVHDLATTIERNIIEWLRLDEPGADLVRYDHLDPLLDGYLELHPLTYAEKRALATLLPLVHCEFALSETDYFLSILHSESKAKLAYEGYFLAHTQWFGEPQGQQLLRHLTQWAETAGSRA